MLQMLWRDERLAIAPIKFKRITERITISVTNAWVLYLFVFSELELVLELVLVFVLTLFFTQDPLVSVYPEMHAEQVVLVE